MQFQVPQFIETEDKIVGPLSLRQFAYVGAAGVLSAMLYFFAQAWLWVIGSIILFGAAIALAFVKIEGRPFANVIMSAFNFYWKPQTYIWQPEHPTVSLPKEHAKASSGASLEDILADAAPKRKIAPYVVAHPAARVEKVEPITRENVSAGSSLHKSWENVQTGAPLAKKNSDKQYLEKKMMERYDIFQKISGDRNAAKRVDYR